MLCYMSDDGGRAHQTRLLQVSQLLDVLLTPPKQRKAAGIMTLPVLGVRIHDKLLPDVYELLRDPMRSNSAAFSAAASLVVSITTMLLHHFRPVTFFGRSVHRFLAEQPAHVSTTPCTLARVCTARERIDMYALAAVTIAALIKGRITPPQRSKCLTQQSIEVTMTNQMLDSAAGHRAHTLQSNLAEEHSDKPRSDSSAPATNSSNDDTTTRDDPVVPYKPITDGENENHSDPDACVDDRDTSASKGQAIWYMATGAARHATGDSSLITNLVPLEQQPENNNGDHQGLCVHAADGTPMPILGHGSVVTSNVVLPDVFYVPGLLTNLVSVGRLAGLDYSVCFGRGTCIVSSADGETVVGRAHAGKDGLYEVEFLRVPLDTGN